MTSYLAQIHLLHQPVPARSDRAKANLTQLDEADFKWLAALAFRGPRYPVTITPGSETSWFTTTLY